MLTCIRLCVLLFQGGDKLLSVICDQQGLIQRYTPSQLPVESFLSVRSRRPICICPEVSANEAESTDLEVEGAGTRSVHIADSSLFVPFISDINSDILQAVQLRLTRTTAMGEYLEQFVIGRTFREVISLDTSV